MGMVFVPTLEDIAGRPRNFTLAVFGTDSLILVEKDGTHHECDAAALLKEYLGSLGIQTMEE